MKTFSSDHFIIPLPADHRFPIEKYTRLRQSILEQGVISSQELHVPDPADDEQIRLAHQADYLERVISGSLSDKEIRRIGFPWSQELVERSRRSVGGTIAACRAAIKDGVAVNLAGGTHHAHPDFGSGYCLLNDCAIAARTMQAEEHAQRVVILDCDVHQGDGTAAIFSSDATVFTYSIHGARNFPFHKVCSDVDIALEDGTSDEPYLQSLESGLDQVFTQLKADLAIYLAGADPYFDDRLGRLSLTKTGLSKRDRLVFRYCQEAGIPIAVVMAGGYARDINDTVDIHVSTVRLAAEVYKSSPLKTHAQ